MVETFEPTDDKTNPPNKIKLVKGVKPLIHFKFYLDIEKQSTATKVENQIKDLGGSIEYFLNKNITHFITNKQQNSTETTSSSSRDKNQSPSVPNLQSVSSPITIYENKSNNLNSKALSRANAILLKARQSQLQSTNSPPSNNSVVNGSFEQSASSNPIQIVKSWGLPVWSTEYLIKFLEKVRSSTNISAAKSVVANENLNLEISLKNRHHKSSKVKSLKGDFIKVETFDKKYRPFYQEFGKSWPKLNLLARLTHSPFETDLYNSRNKQSQKSKFNKFSKIDSRTNATSKIKTLSTIMTRKSRPTQAQQPEAGTNTNNKSGSENKHCGYCEICHVEYDVLKIHLKSEEHLKFAKNDDNFVSLDKLIKGGANVQTFLKFNQEEAKKEIVVNGYHKRSLKKTNQITNGESELEDSDEAYGQHNGTFNGNNLEDNLHEDMEDLSRPKRKCMQSPANQKSKGIKRDSNLEDNSNDIVSHKKSIESKIQATRIRGLRWNAPSPESRPPIKEPPVYKIDKVLNNDNKNSTSKSVTTLNGKDNNIEKQVVVKLKRVRQSELNLLNNEAEQFMFPKTPTFSDTDDTDDDRQTSEINRTNNTTIELLSSDRDVKKQHCSKKKNSKVLMNQQKQENTKITTSPVSKRINKRLEALIEENSKYTHGSFGRLRFQEAPIQPQVTVNTTASYCLSDDRMGDNSFLKSPGGTTHSRWANFKNKYQAIEKDHKFNFERLPQNEPWFSTFHRQDIGFERGYEYFGNTTYSKLPYELGPLLPAKEDCCKLEELIPPVSRGVNNNSTKKRSSCPRMPSIAKVHDRTRSSTAAIIEATKVVDSNDETTNDSVKSKTYLPLKKRKLFIDDVPRKSPREHASTLAILSSMGKDSAPPSISGVNRSGIKRDRLSSQFSVEDDDDNSNCTMTSQQTNKTVATEKDNSSVCSIMNKNSNSSNSQNKYINVFKLCQQINEMLIYEEDTVDYFDGPFGIDDDYKSEEDIEGKFVLLNTKGTDLAISDIMDICSTEELTLKSVATKEKEVQRKITYNSKPKLVTSGFRFNKKRKNNRTGWPIRRKLSQNKDRDDEDNKNLTPDMFAISSDSLDTNAVDFIANTKKEIISNGIDSENDTADEGKKLTTPKSPIKQPKTNIYNRGIGKYQFEKYPKVSLTQLSCSNMKTRSSDLQKRKSITPKKYTDVQNESNRSACSNSSPQKYSPRKLRKPRGRWYRER